MIDNKDSNAPLPSFWNIRGAISGPKVKYLIRAEKSDCEFSEQHPEHDLHRTMSAQIVDQILQSVAAVAKHFF